MTDHRTQSTARAADAAGGPHASRVQARLTQIDTPRAWTIVLRGGEDEVMSRVDVEVLTGTRLFNLAQREADIAFRIVPFEDPDVVQRRLIAMRYGVYVASTGTDPVDGDGAGHRLVAMDTSTGAFPDIDWLKARFPNASVVLRSNNRNVQARMCGRGVGVAVLPRPVGDGNRDLRRLALSADPPSREIWMGYHRDLRRLGRLRAFVDLAVEHLGEQAPQAS